MYVGIANPRWWGKLSRHYRHKCNPQFYVSDKRPLVFEIKSILASIPWHFIWSDLKPILLSLIAGSIASFYELNWPVVSIPGCTCSRSNRPKYLNKDNSHISSQSSFSYYAINIWPDDSATRLMSYYFHSRIFTNQGLIFTHKCASISNALGLLHPCQTLRVLAGHHSCHVSQAVCVAYRLNSSSFRDNHGGRDPITWSVGSCQSHLHDRDGKILCERRIPGYTGLLVDIKRTHMQHWV